MKTSFLCIAASAALLFASCGQSKTEILQDGPWNVDEVLVDGEDVTPDQATWTFNEGGTFTQSSPDMDPQSGTYTFNEETDELSMNVEMNSIQATLSATLTVLESNTMSGTGNVSVLGLNVATFSAKASRP